LETDKPLIKAEKVLTEVIHKIVPKSNADSHATQVKSSNLIPINTTTEQILKARAAAIAAAQNISVQLMQQTNPTQSKFDDKKREVGSTGAKQNIDAMIRDQAAINAEKEAEQRRLEEEMRKRREKIEKWRNEKKAKDVALQGGQEPEQQVKKEKPQAESQPEQPQTSQNNKV
jgi:hypothetical protein